MKSKTSDAGFTLIELMVTITCIAVIAAIAVPKVRGHLLQSRLESAKSYLALISAKQRMYKITTGTYCCEGYNQSEDKLANGLGIDLTDIGDYCFVFICQDNTLCSQTSGSSFITAVPGGTTRQLNLNLKSGQFYKAPLQHPLQDQAAQRAVPQRGRNLHRDGFWAAVRPRRVGPGRSLVCATRPL